MRKLNSVKPLNETCQEEEFYNLSEDEESSVNAVDLPFIIHDYRQSKLLSDQLYDSSYERERVIEAILNGR